MADDGCGCLRTATMHHSTKIGDKGSCKCPASYTMEA